MMFFAYTTMLVSISVMFADAVSVPRATTGKCHTEDTGYLSADNGKWLIVLLDCMMVDFTSLGKSASDSTALTLNSDHELTYKNGTVFKVAFQVSPRSCNEECDLEI